MEQLLSRISQFTGSHILLGPTVNTQRSPLGGRGFESFSEDPQVNGIMEIFELRIPPSLSDWLLNLIAL